MPTRTYHTAGYGGQRCLRASRREFAHELCGASDASAWSNFGALRSVVADYIADRIYASAYVSVDVRPVTTRARGNPDDATASPRTGAFPDDELFEALFRKAVKKGTPSPTASSPRLKRASCRRGIPSAFKTTERGTAGEVGTAKPSARMAAARSINSERNFIIM